MIILREKWLRGDINSSRLCDENNNLDAIGFYMQNQGVDLITLNDQVDPLELVYSDDVLPETIPHLLVQVDLKDSDYQGLHWNLKPEVSDIMLINDVQLGEEVELCSGKLITLGSELEREELLSRLFVSLGVLVTFE